MASAALIVGTTGSGKSTSIRTLDPETTFIISVSGKNLPFPKHKQMYTLFSKDNLQGNYLVTSNADEIVKCMDYINSEMPHIKTIVVDDYIYLASFEFMEKAMETGYTKFNSIGRNIFRTATKYKSLRDDLTVFYLTHSEETVDIDGRRTLKAKLLGKMVENTLTSLEGLFTVVLYAKFRQTKTGIEYYFETANTGDSTVKTPIGMFEAAEIPNDLRLTKETIEQYDS